MKKKKAVLAVTAAVVMATGMAVGTFAWQSIQQKALNKFIEDAGPGARIHDDFDGEEKAVYAENYTKVEENGAKVYVRIRLDEFMELGDDAGKTTDTDGTPFTQRDAKSLIPEAEMSDPSTWRIRLPGDTDTENPFLKYWNWIYGGSTIYMPTFNKNKDSLIADINGTYEGDGQTPYKDHKDYALNEPKETEAYYDADTNTEDEGYDDGLAGNGGKEDENYTVQKETHYAKETATATMMTMEAWVKAGMPIGDYWVWDNDGWFYYAKAVEPDTATGCLLSYVKRKNYPEERYYYGINVVGEFATAYDWGTKGSGENGSGGTGFYQSGMTEDALKLLNQAASVITGEDGASYLDCGQNTYKKIANNGQLGNLICAGMDGIIGNADDITEGVIDLGKDEGGNLVNLKVTVDGMTQELGNLFLAPDSTTLAYRAVGPDGKLGTADDIRLWYTGSKADFPDTTKGTFSFVGADKVEISCTSNVQSLCPKESLKFSADVQLKNTSISNQKVTWTVDGNTSVSTKMEANGTLTIGEDEKANRTLTIKAVSEEDPTVAGTYTVNIEGPGSIVLKVDKEEAEPGDSIGIICTVYAKDGTTYPSQKISWDINGNLDSETTINPNTKKLIIGENEQYGEELTICAKSENDLSISAERTITFPVYKENADSSISIEGTAFWKLKEENGFTLLLTKDVIGEAVIFGKNNARWSDSTIRTYLNGEWLDSNKTLKEIAHETDISTNTEYNNQNTAYETKDTVFLLSEPDVLGTFNGQKLTNSKLYTAGGILSIPSLDDKNKIWWLRTPRNQENYVAAIKNITLDGGTINSTRYVRPALWVDLSSLKTSLGE